MSINIQLQTEREHFIHDIAYAKGWRDATVSYQNEKINSLGQRLAMIHAIPASTEPTKPEGD